MMQRVTRKAVWSADEQNLALMLERRNLSERIAPVAVVAALSALSLLFGDQDRSWMIVSVALSIWVVVFVAAFVVPWGRLPRTAQMIVPIGYLVGVALLRDAEGGAGSGLGMLVVVPVVMVALYGRRVDLILSIVGAALVLGLPIVIVGDPAYPVEEWRRLLIVTAVAILVGFTVQGLVRSMWRQSRHDALTGAANRRVLEERLGVEIARARRIGRPLVVAFLDIDHFKAFNDTRGHLAGDRFLAAVTDAWQAQLRPSDLLARTGGEEFVVVLPECAPEIAAGIAERLRANIPDGLTCSVGLASWNGEESGAELLARADRALYAAKAGGRDRAVVAGERVPQAGSALVLDT